MGNKKKQIFFFIRTSIVFLWCCMMTILISRELKKRPFIDLDERYDNINIAEQEQWYGIYLNNKKIGYSQSFIKRVEEGYHIQEKLFLDMSIMESPQQVHVQLNTVTDSNLMLRIFSFRLTSGALHFIVYGSLEGTTLKMVIDTIGGIKKKELQLKRPLVMATNLKYAVLKQGLATGRDFTKDIFDPVTMDFRTIMVHIGEKEKVILNGKTYLCYKIKQCFDNIDVYGWIDEKGSLIKEESPTGFVMIQEEKHAAQNAGWAERVDILATTAIKPDKPIQKEGLSFLQIRLKNIPSSNGYMLSDGRQKKIGDCITIELEDVEKHHTFTLPYSGTDMMEYLQPEQFIVPNDDMIQKTVRDILGNTTDAQHAVRLLNTWVYNNIEKRPTISIPDARTVLSTRQGDCNEHAVLLAALCRAAGIPARVCAGLVYMRGNFYYHAWNEVYLSAWITIDPSLHQFPADVTHIKCIHGPLQRHAMLLKLIGKLAIEVVAYR
ncbi:MAG: transglutaminase-like domain-containing protein [Desulfobacterota bacterium]|nr:transglutaminase-like domain-containing protein [Thermodesulfobacteriota bacterium]